MYFESDYVLRMIQMMGKFFKRLFEIIDDADKEDEFNQTMRRQCGIDTQTAQNLSVNSLIEMLPDNPRFMLSEMMYLRAHAFNLDDDQRDACLYKSLRLLLSVANENLLCELRKERLLELVNKTHALLKPNDLTAVFRFLIMAQDYAKAEDTLFFTIETTLGKDKAKVLDEGIEAYKKLLWLNDRELETGGLARGEVLEGLQELQRMQDMNE